MAGQNLIAYLSDHATTTLKVKPNEWVGPNLQLQQQLQQRPVVGTDEHDRTKVIDLSRPVARPILMQVKLLVNDLRISEKHATCLYLQVAGSRGFYQGMLSDADPQMIKLIDPLQPLQTYDHVTKWATSFYFYERQLKLTTILDLLVRRLQNSDVQDIMTATDSLLNEGNLVMDLVSLINDYTARINELLNAVRANQIAKSPPSFADAHLAFCHEERKRAAEALLLIAYQTQCETKEVVALVDLIRTLSGQIYKTSPFSDVPNPYEEVDVFGATKEKRSTDWQKDLVKHVGGSGQTELLQCTSLLLVAAVATMNTKEILYNRNLHGPNSFGVGNMMLPPTQPSAENVRGLFQRLDHAASQSWLHKDIRGVLVSSFAVLLRSSPSMMASPGKGGSTAHYPKEFRDAARNGIDVPLEGMSFTFCRLSLIPALQELTKAAVSKKCDVSEIGVSVLAEYYYTYLDVLSENGFPNSRKLWDDEAKDDLRLRHDDQNRQEQFNLWAQTQNQGGSDFNRPREQIPTSVDLMDRPECLDDLIACATALCSVDSRFGRKFWNMDMTAGNVVPGVVLEECLLAASEDPSLLPSVLSLMSVISFDERSADAVYDLLCNNGKPEDNPTDGVGRFSKKNHWDSFLLAVSNYAHQMDPNSGTSSSKPLSSSTSSTSNTGYYYNVSTQEAFDPTVSGYSSQQRSSTTSTSSSKSRGPKYLSPAVTFEVASYLAVIANTCLLSGKARHGMLSIKLGIINGDGVDHDTLTVLFTLALRPLTPQLRGATLSTLASLFGSVLEVDAEKAKFLEQKGLDAWRYLDQCDFVPITRLDRFRHIPPGPLPDSRMKHSFPRSSLTLASSGDDTATVAHDSNFGLLFELERIESKKGWYPSTEGFLELLNSLVRAVGCPPTLGEDWRPRSGCTPYVEYVANFVLPRALGVNGKEALFFRLPGDQSRLVSKALAVVNAVIVRYDLISDPEPCLGIKAVQDNVRATNGMMDSRRVAEDFTDQVRTVPTLVGTPFQGQSATPSASADATAEISVPVPKSPGFTVLAEILSPSREDLDLFQVLGSVLLASGGPDGVWSVVGAQSQRMALVYALYGNTPPTFASAMEGTKRVTEDRKPLQNFLKPLVPFLDRANVEEFCFGNSVSWRERSIEVAMNILCAAAYREEAFISRLNAVPNPPLKLSPVLQFVPVQPRSQNASLDFQSVDLNPCLLRDRFFSFSNSGLLRSSLVDYIGYDSVSNDHVATGIPAHALSLLHFMQKRVSHGNSPPHIIGASFFGDDVSKSQFATAVSKRLEISTTGMDTLVNAQMLRLILDWILVELRERRFVSGGLAQVLLGLSNTPRTGRDCFDVICATLGWDDVALQSPEAASVASMCYEIIFRLYNMFESDGEASKKLALDTADRLRAYDFWQMSVSRLPGYSDFLGDTSDPVHANEVLHCMAWLLSGVSWEMRLLVGFAHDPVVAMRESGHHRKSCAEILFYLYQGPGFIFKKVVGKIPLEIPSSSPLPPPHATVLEGAQYDMVGPTDVVKGYILVDANKAKSLMAAKSIVGDSAAAEIWIDRWNLNASRNCAVTHLARAVGILVYASLSSSDELGRTSSSLGGITGYDSQWIYRNGAQEIMKAILGKLDINRYEKRGMQGMDSVLIPSATRELSNGTLQLAFFISESSKQGLSSPSDIVQLGILVAQILDTSCTGNSAAGDTTMQMARSVVFGSALILLLQQSSSLEPRLVKQHIEDFSRAAYSLAKISCAPQNSEPQQMISAKARSCLASLIVAMRDNEATSMNSSFVCSLFSHAHSSFLEQLFSMLKNLDEGVCTFLQTVAMQPFGADFLAEKGIGQALKEATKILIERESSRETSQQETLYSSGNNSLADLATPVLVRQWKLICSLLTSFSGQFPQHQRKFAEQCADIMQSYDLLLERMTQSFPQDIECLQWGVRCLVLTYSLGQPLASNAFNHDDGFKQRLTRSNFVQKCVPMLVDHLIQHPLPNDMIPTRLPRELQRSATGDDCWWNRLRDDSSTYRFDAPSGKEYSLSLGSPKKWTETTFKKCISAMEICSMGLVLMQRTKSPPRDILGLARGLYFTIFAAGTVGARDAQLSNQNNLMETEDGGNIELEKHFVHVLASTLARCSEQALQLALSLSDGKENYRPITVSVSSSLGALRFFPTESKEYSKFLCSRVTG
ncbi:MAG: hypothetical protein SGILL_003317 [Bacillariaceae sp.]